MRERGGTLHVLFLDLPVERCVQNVVSRRRAGRGARPAIERTARTWQEALLSASNVLANTDARVAWLDPPAELCETLALLGLAAGRQEWVALRQRFPVPSAAGAFPALAGLPEHVT